MKANRLTPAAEDDLFEIWMYIAQDDVIPADQLESEFFDTFQRLAKRPDLGHFRHDLTDKPVRFFTVRGTYLIVYDPARTVSSGLPGQISAEAFGHRQWPPGKRPAKHAQAHHDVGRTNGDRVSAEKRDEGPIERSTGVKWQNPTRPTVHISKTRRTFQRRRGRVLLRPRTGALRPDDIPPIYSYGLVVKPVLRKMGA